MTGYLYLEDGQIIEGESFGAELESTGEVVFSTGMTGYCESLTDPSFAGQILTFTYPLIGNYGVPKPVQRAEHLMQNFESERIWVEGVIVSDLATEPSHHAMELTFAQWLQKNKVPALRGVDTRALTQKLRERGTMRGKILLKKVPAKSIKWQPLQIADIVARASHKKVVKYQPEAKKFNGTTIALLDCGVKHGILRALLDTGYKVIRIPWDMNPLELDEKIDGVFCSNGPGDPKDCQPTIANIRKVIAAKLPFLGVCLGHQLLALAVGADTYKLPYGHRGLNQPVQDLTTRRAYLTSQNHGYAVDRKTIPADFEEWFINLNDQTSEGIRSTKQKAWSVQFHPEGSPGPFDTAWIFSLLQKAK